MATHDIRSYNHLINILSNTVDHHPNFSLLLGAGASIESGVSTANEMIRDWRTQIQKIDGSGGDLSDFLKRCTWFEKDEEYSTLFELLYDQPSQRREFIERCLGSASPSWGYIYLVNLLEKNTFNTVFTTSFDDLLNEACHLFSTRVRPIVCAHDSSIASIRITSRRPKIIKLHGDFLFDSIKNTIRELESLEENMRAKFKQFAREFGLITIGYSGRDRSVMDTIEALMHDRGNFPHGVYWCIREGSLPSRAVDRLSRFPNFHLVRIESFDAFFASLHDALGLSPHPIVDDPYRVVATRLSDLLNRLRVSSASQELPLPVERDIIRICQAMAKPNHESVQDMMPYKLLAYAEARRENYEKALELIAKSIDESPEPDSFDLVFKILEEHWDQDKARAGCKTLLT